MLYGKQMDALRHADGIQPVVMAIGTAATAAWRRARWLLGGGTSEGAEVRLEGAEDLEQVQLPGAPAPSRNGTPQIYPDTAEYRCRQQNTIDTAKFCWRQKNIDRSSRG
jgi:hypothetical protein